MYPAVNCLFFRYRPLPPLLIKVTSEKRCTYRILIRSYLNPVVLTLSLLIMGTLPCEADVQGIKFNPKPTLSLSLSPSPILSLYTGKENTHTRRTTRAHIQGIHILHAVKPADSASVFDEKFLISNKLICMTYVQFKS